MWIAKSKSTGQHVAIKVLAISQDILEEIEEEYTILNDLGGKHLNIPGFYGAYVKPDVQADQIWFVLEVLLFICCKQYCVSIMWKINCSFSVCLL